MNAIRQLAARLRRLHPFTWCVMAVVTVVMVLIMVPGENVYRDRPDASSSQWQIRGEVREQTYDLMIARHRDLLEASPNRDPVVDVFEHGWPRPYLVRSLGHLRDNKPNPFAWPQTNVFHPPRSEPGISWGDKDPFGFGNVDPYVEVRWSSADHWPYRSDVWHWQWGNLLLDTALLIAILALVAFATERWIRWRGGLFRLRVAELLVGFTLCALVLGWVKYHQRIAKVEAELESLSEVTPDGIRINGVRFSNPVVMEVKREYVGPTWIRKLLGGDEQMLPLLHHVTDCTYRGYESSATSNKNWRQDLMRIGQLQYLKRLKIVQPPSKLRNPAWRHMPLFLSIDQSAAPLTKVEQFTLRGHCFFKGDIEAACQLIQTKKLVLQGVALTNEEFEQLQQSYPQMEISLESLVTTTELQLPPLGQEDLVELLRKQRQRAMNQ